MAHLQRKRRITQSWHRKCVGFQPRPGSVVNMKTLKEFDGSPAWESQSRGARDTFQGDTCIALYPADIGRAKLLSFQEESELAARIKKGDREARDQIIKSNLQACQTVLVEVLRNGSAKPLLVILGQAPDKELALQAEWSPEEQHPGTLQGVVLIELSSQVRQHLRIPRDVQGAVVLDLHAYSAAAEAGLRPGDVIESIDRQEVRDAEDVSRLTQNAKHKRALLRVWSNSGSHFILIED